MTLTIVFCVPVSNTYAASRTSTINKAVSWATKAAANRNIGYTLNTSRRWGPYDYDCGTFVTTAYRKAGLSLSGFVVVGNSMVNIYKANGFKWITSYNLNSYSNLKKGDVLVDKDQHTEMYIGGGKLVGAHWDWDGVSGDSSGREVSVQNYYNNSGNIHWDGVLRYVGNASKPTISSAKLDHTWYDSDDTITATMSAKREKSRTLTIYSKSTGEKVYSTSIGSSGKVTLSASKLSSGYYYAKFTASNSVGTDTSKKKYFCVNTVPSYSSFKLTKSSISSTSSTTATVTAKHASSITMQVKNTVTGATKTKTTTGSSCTISGKNYDNGLYDVSFILKNKAGSNTTSARSLRIYGTKSKTVSRAATSSSFTYDGSKKTPSLKVYDKNYNVVSSKYYKVSYSTSRVNAGTVSGKVTGTKGYSGSAGFSFTIKRKSASDATIASMKERTYTGKLITPKPSVKLSGKKLVSGQDYTMSWSNVNTKGTVKVSFIGNYKGSASKTFTINKVSITKCSPKLAKTKYTFSHALIKPAVSAGSLTQNKDYKVTYTDNYNAGTAKASVQGKGMVTGTKSLKFTIEKQDINNLSIKVASCTYNGKLQKPAVTCQAVSDNSCKLKYSNNRNAGTGKVTLTGTGNYTGTTTKTFTINRRQLSTCNMIGFDSRILYSGKPVKQTVRFTYLGKNATFSNVKTTAKTIGVHKAVYRGTGNFTGTVTKTFRILPHRVTHVKLTAWNKTIRVHYPHVAGRAHYEIAVRKAGSTTYHIKKTARETVYLRGLSRNTRYIIKVRAYRNGVYGKWSVRKAVRTN
ncbi:MAG: fibronectin type III domain-containing protein [Anaerovoracaceae bacterium]